MLFGKTQVTPLLTLNQLRKDKRQRKPCQCVEDIEKLFIQMEGQLDLVKSLSYRLIAKKQFYYFEAEWIT